jgi:C4-dicarboxylate transporter, DctQ subunit
MPDEIKKEKPNHPTFRKIDGAINQITRVISWLCGGAALWLFGLIFVNVFLRYLFESPYRHADEIVRFSMAWISYIGMAYTLRVGGHISVDLVTSRLPSGFRRRLEMVGFLAVTIWIALITYAGWKLWIRLFSSGQRSFGLLEVELWIPGICIIVGLSWFFVEALIELARRVLNVERAAETVNY